MPYVVAVKHGEPTEHAGMVDALADYLECYDEHGCVMWWEDEPGALAADPDALLTIVFPPLDAARPRHPYVPTLQPDGTWF